MNKNPIDFKELESALQALINLMPPATIELTGLSAAKRRKIGGQIQLVIDRLQLLLNDVDSVRQPPYVLDPSDPQIVGHLIADTLLVQERQTLNSVTKFYGSGIYALYYNGPFDAYQPLVGSETPIYVGKVDPSSAQATTPAQQGPKLHGRLNEHLKSIRSSVNLESGDFECRFLVVKSAWQNTAETYLINRYQPIWNNETNICFGIGKHGDKAETRQNARSPWDTLHPGRKWAEGSKPYKLSIGEIKDQISEHFKKFPPTGA